MAVTIQSLSRAAGMPVVNPATGATIAHVADMGEDEALAACSKAGRAFAAWAAVPAVERERILLRAAELMRAQTEDLARIITAEQGKPLQEARDEIAYGANFVAWYAAEGRRTYGDTIPATDPQKRLLVFPEPVGPVLLVAASNDPHAMVTRKGAPALAAGCPIVIKPAPETPLSALACAALFHAAGVPDGIVSVVTTSRSAAVTKAMLGHDDIRHLTFTGSSHVGKVLGAQAGGLMKPMTMELGGHAPFVVYDDAEVELAAADLAARKFTNAGQTCSCPQRIFLQEAIAPRFLEALAAKIDAIVVGDGTDPRVTMGPLLSAQAVTKVERHVSDALAKGAKVVRGGMRIDRGPGTLHAPTLLTEASDAMLLAQEETFGPVAAVWRFRDESELMPRLNHPSYGLTGYCYTRDIGRAFRTSKAMRVGFIGLNDRRPQGPEVPLGGVRDSGLGREGGRWGIEEFLTMKYLSLRLPAAP